MSTTMFESTDATKTDPSELDTFKALVHRKARAAKRQQGWDTAKMNAVLIELGLEPVPTYVIEAPFTATGVYVQSLDGYTEAQVDTQIANIKAWSDRDLLAQVRSTALTITDRPEPKRVVAGVEGAVTAEEAKTTDLAAYKRFVRKVSIRVAKDNGWCDTGLNEYLEAMGLPEKRNHYVTVEVPLTQRISVLVAEAESAEEARALLAEGGEVAEQAVRDQLGTTVRLTGKPVVPDMEELMEKAQVGDRPDPTYDPARGFIADFTTEGRCRQYDRQRNYTCTRGRGHSGRHVAGNGSQVVAAWNEGEGYIR